MVEPLVARVVVLGQFSFEGPGGPLQVSRTGQRLIAALALHDGSLPRHRLKALLWPTSIERRAEANLRATTWRLPEFIGSSIDNTRSMLALPDSWGVDVHDARHTAERIRTYGADEVDASCLTDDVLPDWNDEWLFVARESHRQLRLHALEALTEHQLRTERPLDAVDTAMQALAAEPLRESAQQLVLRAHLAAGNRSEVQRLFEQFRRLLAAELAVEPTPAMRALLEDAATERS